MCCRCCGVTQQKFWVFGLGTLLTAIGIFLIVWWPDWIDDMVFRSLPLSPCSRTYDMWAVTPVPIYLYMYLFNWTNAEEVQTNGVKPHFDQVGPYVYRELRTKEDITWHSNKTVTFYSNRTWFFEPELSGGKPDDLVTCPHLPSIAASNVVRDENKVIKAFFNNALNKNGGALYQTHTANEWLFEGFYDEFLDYAMKLNNSMTGDIQSNHFAWFLDRNSSKTFEGTFNIHTGQGDLQQMGELKNWRGMNHTGFYEGECGRLNGSTSDLFVPNRPRDEFITIFIPDTCRVLNLEPTGEKVVLEGVEGMRYETTANTFDNGQFNSDMKCYCPKEKQPDNCPASGATDLGPCSDGAPMFMSHSNFMYADPSYADTITGMKPDRERDTFFIVMETKLGVPLQVNAAVMVSLFIQQDTDITILRNIPNFYAPLFVTSSKAAITKELAKDIKLALSLPAIGLGVGIAFLVLGVILLFVGIVLTMKNLWYNEKMDDASEPITEN